MDRVTTHIMIATGVWGMFVAALPLSAQTQSSIHFVDANAPAEVLACEHALVADESAAEAERIFGELSDELTSVAIRTGITEVGEPFVRGLAPKQTAGTYPLVFEFCMPINRRPGSNQPGLAYIDEPAHPVWVGFCGSPDPAVCSSAIQSIISAASSKPSEAEAATKSATVSAPPLPEPSGAGIGPLPAAEKFSPDSTVQVSQSPAFDAGIFVRSGLWYESSPPATAAAMVGAVYRMRPPAVAPPITSDTTEPGPVSFRDEKPRELGNIPGIVGSGSPPILIEAPTAQPVAGLVFSVRRN